MATRIDKLQTQVNELTEKLATHTANSPFKNPPSARTCSAEEWNEFERRVQEHGKAKSFLEVDLAMAETALEDMRKSRVKPIMKFEQPDGRMRRAAENLAFDEALEEAM